jgi:hypothetical protein
MKNSLIGSAVSSRVQANSLIHNLNRRATWVLTLALGLIVCFVAVNAEAQNSILDQLGAPQVLSTVPSNGDVNPYGVAFVPAGFPSGGLLKPGDILVSNYNDNQNLQGTGSTIVDFRNGLQTVFFQDWQKAGLSTGLAVLKAGFVLVASMPTTDGTAGTVQPGSLLAINSAGQIVWSLAGKSQIDGPWDFTVYDQGATVTVFVSNVLNGTIERLVLGTKGGISLISAVEISSNYNHRGDPAALEVGPTGLAYDPVRDTLYVAASFENAVYAIPDATAVGQNGGKGYRIYSDNLHLHGALALTLAPNGNLICSNSDVINSVPGQPSELVEFTRGGTFVAEYSVDPNLGGAFGLQFGMVNGYRTFAAVDDNTATLEVWTLN